MLHQLSFGGGQQIGVNPNVILIYRQLSALTHVCSLDSREAPQTRPLVQGHLRGGGVGVGGWVLQRSTLHCQSLSGTGRMMKSRRRGPGRCHASRGIDVFFRRRTRSSAPMRLRFKKDSVEAVQSLPQEGGFDVAEQRADARMPQRITAMAAVTKAMESDPEARQTSMRVCCGRCPSLRPL